MKTSHEKKYKISKFNGKRYANSAIPKMLNLLNKERKIIQFKALKKCTSILNKRTDLGIYGIFYDYINL